MERLATGFGLIEGPVWDPARGLYFSDVSNGGVHLLDRAGKVAMYHPGALAYEQLKAEIEKVVR